MDASQPSKVDPLVHLHVLVVQPASSPSPLKKAKALWSMRDAKANGEAYNDQSSERQTESRASVGQALWEAHMRSPTAALEEALIRTEDGA